jgi:hypothetical protein
MVAFFCGISARPPRPSRLRNLLLFGLCRAKPTPGSDPRGITRCSQGGHAMPPTPCCGLAGAAEVAPSEWEEVAIVSMPPRSIIYESRRCRVDGQAVHPASGDSMLRATCVNDSPPSDRATVKRLPQRGSYDRAKIRAILDEGLICNVAFLVEGQACVIPTLYVRLDDRIYLHGSPASRMLQALQDGGTVSVAAGRSAISRRSCVMRTMHRHPRTLYRTTTFAALRRLTSTRSISWLLDSSSVVVINAASGQR